MSAIKNNGITGGEVEGFMEVDANEVYVPEGRFRPLDKKAVKVIEESIQKNGQLQPILIDKNGNLIDGNHRLNACINLGISCIAKVVDEVDEDKLALMEIDTNLCRKELSASELEIHLAERKKIYLRLYPETAKGSFTKSEAKSFAEDTADTMGVSKKTIERLVKRGEESTDEMREARDSKVITNSELDEVIKETSGLSVEDKNKALKDKLKAKAESKEQPVKEAKPEVDTEVAEKPQEAQEVITDTKELGKLNSILEEQYASLYKEFEEATQKVRDLEVLLDAEKDKNKKLRDRISKAKELNPSIKI